MGVRSTSIAHTLPETSGVDGRGMIVWEEQYESI